MDLPRMERLMAKNQNEMETEYNTFVQQLSGFVNHENSKPGCMLTLLQVPLEAMQNTHTQVRKTTQTMSG